MQSTSIFLPEPLKQFVDRQVAEGRYSSVSEYVRELIRSEARRKADEQVSTVQLDGLNDEKAGLKPGE